MKLMDIHCEPFTRVEYRTPGEERRWSEKLRRCTRIAGDVELGLVKAGHREASTLLLRRDEIERRRETLAEERLLFTAIRWVKKFKGFAHRHDLAGEEDPSAVCYGVVTRTHAAAERFVAASLPRHPDHDAIGALLGYPPCCREFFSDAWARGFIDPIWQQAFNTGGEIVSRPDGGHELRVEGYPECVAHQRYWGARIGFHLPCSFVCQKTRALAHLWLEVAESLDPGISADMMEAVSLESVWDAHRGVALVNTPYYKGTTGSVPCADVHTVYFSPLTA
ncbi:MAG: hypothetical protein JXA24_05405 [Proteobacteria bacterium]|nr:hypothetical protein [Pseudomonadota bacterium]